MKKKRILLGIALTAASLFAITTVTSCNNASDSSSETEGDKFTVKFDTQGGSKIDDVKVDKNTAVAKPADPTRNGYEFKGWFKEKACTNAWDFTKPITEDKTLYAKWEQKDSITGIELSGTYKTRYKKGDTFSTDGLVVTELHTKDDNVTLTADKYTVTIEDEAGNAVAANAPFATAGFYTATVKATASNKTAEYDFKVTTKSETLVDYDYSPDTYGTAKSLTTANDGLTANEAIASLAEGRIRMVAMGSKVKYQQVDSNGNSVGTTYNSVEYGSRLQVNTGTADGAIKLVVSADANVTLYAKGDIGRGIKITNVDTDKAAKDPKACEFVEEDGNKEVMREFKYYLNAGEYYINSTTGGGVNIYNFIVSLYEPSFDPNAPITDLAFSPVRTVFYESEVFSQDITDTAGNVDLAVITDGLTVTSTKDEVDGNPVNYSDCTFALYKGDTQVHTFTDAGTYNVKVTVGSYSKAYPITYSKSKKFELKSPYTEVTVQKNTPLPLLGYAQVTMDNDKTVFYGVDSAFVTVKYYTTKGTDGDGKTVYSNEVNEATALGSVGKVYAEVSFNDSLLPLACFADAEAGNKKTLYFEVTVQDGKAPAVWNYTLENYVTNYDSLKAGKKTDKTISNPVFIAGVVTANKATYKAAGSFGSDGIELTKSADELSIVIESGYTATVKINVGSTSGTNATDKIYLKQGTEVVDGESTACTEASDHTFSVTGTDKDKTITYTLTAGTYKFGTTCGDRGVRVYSIEIIYTAA